MSRCRGSLRSAWQFALVAVVVAVGVYASGASGESGHRSPAQAVALTRALDLLDPLQGPTRISGKFRNGWPQLILDHCDVLFHGLGR